MGVPLLKVIVGKTCKLDETRKLPQSGTSYNNGI
jgi:hypothetical protein